jgi:hypothetical protein
MTVFTVSYKLFYCLLQLLFSSFEYHGRTSYFCDFLVFHLFSALFLILLVSQFCYSGTLGELAAI